MHHMTTLKTSQRLRRRKHTLAANRTASLELLWDAAMIFVSERNTRIASHAVTKVNAQSFSHSAGVAIRTVEDGMRPIIVQMADATKVLCEWLSVRFAMRIQTAIFGGL